MKVGYYAQQLQLVIYYIFVLGHHERFNIFRTVDAAVANSLLDRGALDTFGSFLDFQDLLVSNKPRPT
jgi:hypothetical protein